MIDYTTFHCHHILFQVVQNVSECEPECHRLSLEAAPPMEL